MFNKFSTKTLISLFVLLLLVVVIFIYVDSKHGERTFKTQLVDIDTSQVTSISLFPQATNHKEVKIYKEGKGWKVNLKDNKTADVPEEKVQSLLGELTSIKASRLAATGESQWKNFKVDSEGTEIKVFQGSDNTLDIIIGKFEYERPRNMTTFVRLQDDKDVYGVNGFLSFEFNHDANYFRDNHVIDDYYSNWKKLTYTYPGDSSFVLEKKGKNWEINNKSTDSAATVVYLRSISNLTSENMDDNVTKNTLGKALYHLSIESSSKGIIEVTAYQDGSELIINSSQNPDTYFNATANKLWEKIFVGKSHFFPSKVKKKAGKRK
jgi:Domain of unknown function (DUF4340)